MIAECDFGIFKDKFSKRVPLPEMDDKMIAYSLAIMRKSVNFTTVGVLAHVTDISEELKKLKHEMLIIMGEQDLQSPYEEHCFEYLEIFKERVKLLTFEGCSHFPVTDKPKLGEKYIMEFIKRLEEKH